MLPLTLAEIAAACGGGLASVDPSVVVRGISIDSRSVHEGDLFVALKGEHSDGLEFARDAISRGAVAVLARSDAGVASVLVDDPTVALGRIASDVRATTKARVVGITGSSGKTVTKDLTAAAVGSAFRTSASIESFNNEIGVPLTVCSVEPDTEVLVAEVGSRGRGHIASLMPILRPDVGAVTNVGSAHHAMFGTLEETTFAKGELIEALPDDGVAILNADDDRVLSMRGRTTAKAITFGYSAAADIRAVDVELDARACARFVAVTPSGRTDVVLAIAGEHMVPNALAALAICEALDVPIHGAAEALAQVLPAKWRMQVLDTRGGITLINDSYNANPASAAAALKALAAIGRGRRTWAVLGEMAELGDIATEEHDRLGRLAVRLGVNRLIAVGGAARPACEAARLECMTPEEAVFAEDVDAAISYLRAHVAEGDVVLIKASRVAGFERIATALIGATP